VRNVELSGMNYSDVPKELNYNKQKQKQNGKSNIKFRRSTKGR
jgi:hypothetical protein